ncbi:MAG: ABC transporter permease [Methylococcales bacterium]|nr:ABC transporter permease [Methylococcales bacterium]
MNYFSEAFFAACQLIIQFDPAIYQIVFTSLKISFIATFFASLIGIFLGINLAIHHFTGKQFVQHLLNTAMAMPTVMIGLIFYGLFSRRGLLGDWQLLYTDTAVIIGEAFLITPIIINLTFIAVHASDPRLLETLKMLGATAFQQIMPIFSECRLAILAAIITGFGRAIGEVGAAMMLGGNIQGTTRTMTTAIALETSKGDFERGLALGLLLLLIAFGLNLGLQYLSPDTR